MPRLLRWAPFLLAGACSPRSPALRPGDIPIIDVHTHYAYARPFLIPVLERWNMRAVLINYTADEPPDSVRRRWDAMLALRASAPGRFILCTTFEIGDIDQPGFASRVIQQLERDIQAGATMVKVWKDVGLRSRDASGRFVQIDDLRLQPIWDFLVERGVPVLVHSADPREAWLPPNPNRVHYQYFAAHPQENPYLHPELPRWEEIIGARDRWLSRNPRLVVIGAHLGSMADDLTALGNQLDAHPNFYVDVAARIRDLRRLDRGKVRTFLLRYQDRILYGTDQSLMRPWLSTREVRAEQRSLERQLDTDWRFFSQQLALSPEALRKVYFQNAEHVLHLVRPDALNTAEAPPGGPAETRVPAAGARTDRPR